MKQLCEFLQGPRTVRFAIAMSLLAGVLCWCVSGCAKPAPPPSPLHFHSVVRGIRIEFDLPKPQRVTIVINNAQGRRVRNLISNQLMPAGENTVIWHGYDDGRWEAPNQTVKRWHLVRTLCPPGTYRAVGLTHSGIKLRYEFSVYSPGNPPWRTPNGQGAWLSDHRSPNACLLLPHGLGCPVNSHGAPRMMISASLAETGYSIIWTKLNGQKVASESLSQLPPWSGAYALARDNGPHPDSQYAVYSINGNALMGWTANGKWHYIAHFGQLNRSPGHPQISGWAFGGLAVYDGIAVISNADNWSNVLLSKRKRLFNTTRGDLLVVNVRTGKILADNQTAPTRGVAFDKKGRLLVLMGRQLKRFNLNSVTGQLSGAYTLIRAHLDRPRRVQTIPNGEIVISDWGRSNQVKVFSPHGRFLRAIGEPGGAQVGVYNPLRMDRPDGFAITPQGVLWVAENTMLPKRVSLWNFATGKFIKAFYGGPQYGGGGSIDPADKSLFLYSQRQEGATHGVMIFKLNWKKGTSRLVDIPVRFPRRTRFQSYSRSVAYLPDPAHRKVLMPWDNMATSLVDQALPLRIMNADGHRYLIASSAIWLWDGPVARPVAMFGEIGTGNVFPPNAKYAAAIKKLFAHYPDGTPWVWSDLNGDGFMEPDEFQFGTGPLAKPWWRGRIGGFSDCELRAFYVQPDLAVTGWRVEDGYLPAPKINAAGVPIYNIKKLRPMARVSAEVSFSQGLNGGTLLMAPNGNIVDTPGGWGSHAWNFTPCQGYQLGKGLQWTYPYHGYDYGPPKKPGQWVTGTLYMGPLVHPRKGQAGWLFFTNGGKGSMYVMTTDGLFIQTLGGDVRDHPMRGSNPALNHRGALCDGYTFVDEDFFNSVTQTASGKVYIVAGKDDMSIYRLLGLSSICRRNFGEFHLTTAMTAGKPQRLMPAALEKGRPTLAVPIVRRAPKLTPTMADWKTAAADWAVISPRITAALAISHGKLYACWKTNHTHLLTHGPSTPALMFKGGGALDIMLSNNGLHPGHDRHPMQGDERLLVTRVGGKTVAVLYRQVAHGAPAAEHYLFQSPIGKVEFDQILNVSRQVHLYQLGKNYEISVPLSVLAMPEPRPGYQTIGDIGVLVGNGTKTVDRLYWSNKNTSIVSDIPSEARLEPANWGILKVVR